MTDVFIAEVRRSLRAALFRKLRPYGLSQDDVTQLVAAATTSAMAVADIPALADAAALAAPVAQALRAVAPDNAALTTYDTGLDRLPAKIRRLSEPPEV